jgi:hypothetical protein
MMQFTKGLKIAPVRVGFLTSLGLAASLFVSGPVSADPGKYRNTQVKPIVAVTTADDFRAPPSDPIETGSTGLIETCSGATYDTCAPKH